MEGNLNIRGIDPQTVALIKTAAGSRGMTIAQYVERLVGLHQVCRNLADKQPGAGFLQDELMSLGLETVSR